MQAALAGTAFVMGLAGGSHCLAMCSAACASVIQVARVPRGEIAVLPTRGTAVSTLAFHTGRLVAYSVAGALAALMFQSLGWASQQTTVLRPVWVLAHTFIFVWALVLMAVGRQPIWADRIGRSLSERVRPWVGSPIGLFATGALWVLLPCPLLYSALMLAGLSSGPMEGAWLMALFVLGSSLWLVLAPWLWTQLRQRGDLLRKEWGTRLAGLLLAVIAGQALWMDMHHQIQLWCGY